MEKSKDRLEVIENIKKNLSENKLNSKVEANDPVITEEFFKERILNYDIFKKKPINKIKNVMTKKIVYNFVEMFNAKTQIIGIENLQNVKTGAIITSNHFSPQDSTPIIYALKKLKKQNDLNIVVTEANLAMEGELGFIFNNYNMIPLSNNKEYTEKKFIPAIKKLLEKKHFILIYPEQEMWFNYRKVRNLKPGAYHLAAKFKVPIIPCFMEMHEISDEYEENGFNKLQYTLHIMPPIYPDEELSLKENKIALRQKDYDIKKKAFEEAYGREMTYTFEEDDIAGLKA